MRDRHSTTSTYPCPVDGCIRQTRVFKRDDNLIRHLEKVHHLDKADSILRTLL
jgi:uncharacterized C2H2 Zn-finger protein